MVVRVWKWLSKGLVELHILDAYWLVLLLCFIYGLLCGLLVYASTLVPFIKASRRWRTTCFVFLSPVPNSYPFIFITIPIWKIFITRQHLWRTIIWSAIICFYQNARHRLIDFALSLCWFVWIPISLAVGTQDLLVYFNINNGLASRRFDCFISGLRYCLRDFWMWFGLL